MKLILDLGNTTAKLALYQGAEQVAFHRFDNAAGYELLLEHVAKLQGLESAILSSVVNHPLELEQAVEQHCRLIKLDHNTPLPIQNGYATPATLGRDRIAVAVAVADKWPEQPALAIDAGSSITFDFVSPDGTYQGGSIAPGIDMRFKALHTFTDQLPLIGRANWSALTGKTTEESILAGVIGGARAEVTGCINAYRQQWPALQVAITGGDQSLFEKAVKMPIFAHPHLVLMGLNAILSFNDPQEIH